MQLVIHAGYPDGSAWWWGPTGSVDRHPADQEKTILIVGEEFDHADVDQKLAMQHARPYEAIELGFVVGRKRTFVRLSPLAAEYTGKFLLELVQKWRQKYPEVVVKEWWSESDGPFEYEVHK